MCCPLILLVLVGPRLAFLFAWIFTPRVTEAFTGGWVLPLLGFLFLPWTSLFFILAWAPNGGVVGIGWFFVAIGFFFDIASYSSRAAQQRYQPAR